MRTPRRDTSAFPRVWTPGRPSAVVLILSILLGFAGVQFALHGVDLLSGGSQSTEFLEALCINSEISTTGHYWKWFTYALVHADWVHFLINFGIIFAAGREVEPIIGRRQFLALSLFAWVGGGIASWMAFRVNSSVDADISGVVGFSAPAAAILAAYSTIMPELEQRVNVFFMVPLRFRAKFYALVVAAFSILGLLTDTPASVGLAGILFGCVLGWLWAKHLGFGNPLWIQRMVFERRQKESRLSRMPPAEFVAQEVDPLLDKITRSGVQSLTRAEWRVLQQGSRKLDSKSKTGSGKGCSV